jgi:hypothetical protein
MADGALLRYDVARQAIAEARTIDEVRDWEDKVAAVREYARRAKNRDMEIDAAEIRVRAQRRRGELLAEMKASGLLQRGREKTSSVDDISRITLADLDTTPNESSQSQKLAAIAPDAFERLAARVRERLAADDKLHTFDVLRERDGPVHGARSVMGSRQEPDDSLDYFPTPPWATRALAEIVLPHLGVDWRTSGDWPAVWDPACGEGHITGVLEEYRCRVLATDIHDYSVDGRTPPSWWKRGDFLAAGRPDWPDGYPDIDWIITNPPFEEKATFFVLRALEQARQGVAMFFRLQWLETIERYEAIFRDRPPTLIAFFAERVNLCKGRWDPDGSTATAYIWLIWQRGRAPQAPLWIPPGQRAALTRPDDRERFTAQPVIRVVHAPPHDPETGEILEEAGSAAGATGKKEFEYPREQSAAGEDGEDASVASGHAAALDNSDRPGESRKVLSGPDEATAAHPAAVADFATATGDDDLEIPAFLRRSAA